MGSVVKVGWFMFGGVGGYDACCGVVGVAHGRGGGPSPGPLLIFIVQFRVLNRVWYEGVLEGFACYLDGWGSWFEFGVKAADWWWLGFCWCCCAG
jgi:hypothetical protein